MAYLDDFIDNTLAFLQQNIVYVLVPKETNGLIDVAIAPRGVATTISNIPAGVVGGVSAGGVYSLRPRVATDARAMTVYFCGYEQNTTVALTLGNAALWMFTATMDGCTFGAGSQGPNSNGAVRVAHANNSRMGNPQAGITTATDGAMVGRPAQRWGQKLHVTSHTGPPSILIEPDSYMGGNFDQKATTFGYHAAGGAWTFKALSYRQGGNVWMHGGVIDYP